jgi:transcriptional regulator of acetoin/glycerol metabolism
MAVSVGAFERLSRKLERFPHVLSLLDKDGVVLYSTGTTGMARREHRIPGVDWSKDYRGISSAARAIAAGVPVTVIGALDLHGTFTPSVRLACPVRLSDGSVSGVLNLTIEVTRARPDHLLELCKVARTVCKFVENGPMGAVRTRDQKSRVQPFVDAARNVATVLSLPQLDPGTRMALSGLLADLENTGRELILKPTVRRRGANVRAHGAS